MLPAELRVEVVFELEQRRVRAARDRYRRGLVPGCVHLDVVFQRAVVDVIWNAGAVASAMGPLPLELGMQFGRGWTYGGSIVAQIPSRTARRTSFLEALLCKATVTNGRLGWGLVTAAGKMNGYVRICVGISMIHCFC